ncbi:MAG TPA: YiiD C-terminal domain-containing protein [Thermoanaerobaculia bacterium]
MRLRLPRLDVLTLIKLWPPYLGAGIRVRRPDDHTYVVRMKLRWWNRNYFGTHFGGSLYAMCDPFFALILAQRLGKGYVVWDKAAAIRFVRPGRGTVTATFHLPPDEVEAIRQAADAAGKIEPELTVDVVDEAGAVVARVEKTLYVRREERIG